MRSRLQSSALRESQSLFRFFEKLLHPYPAAEPPLPPQGFFAFLWACTQGVRGKILAMAVLTAVMSTFEALLFALLGRVVDWLGGQAPSRLWEDRGTTLAWMAGLLVASIAVVALQTIVKHQTLAINLPMRLRWNFHRLMLGQSMAFYQDEFAGRITAKVMQTALAVRETVFVLADVLVAMGVYVATMIVLVGVLDTQLIWPFLIWLAFYIGALIYFVPRLGAVGKAQADARALMTGRVTDAYTNIATVKLFSHTQREAGFARDAMREFMHTGYGQMRLVSAFEIVNHTLSMGLTAGMAGTALWLWSTGAVGVGAVAAATAMALRLQGMSHWIMWEMTSLFENIGTVQDGMKTLSRPRAVLDAPGAKPLEVPRGEVRFEHASFRYGAAGGRRVIEDLTLTVAPGEKIGLVGRSGAGKSTLVNLLLRFHDLESGRILIDGQDIALATQDSLRSHIGMVTQDTSLMHRSVADNIAYGRPDATPAQIEAAARRAEAHDFIGTLGDASGRRGYEAHVGERGVKLSGGQRQRIAIARVMLKDAPILLLDEATSALDSEVEAAIQQSLYTLMEGKTVIAIAHRLSTIAAMDRLIVLDEGRVVEEGDHRTLMAKGGLYARLWAHQSGGFLGDALDEEEAALA
ncbi:multidrug ABC transporter ATP-binding protein [Variovorax paradoxus]|jgi:ATP-binding cassette subfamily B multidrug efflux pump|nr:multidrug ABC transporter ATP-binding protein [Variovorax paradoxus]KPU92086.1 multidrug ABC transporter ATP-binding protein [Variovorax paradoxus]KPU96317.1 multidrug ABC transporter ATP-binding protein [Variovorax paradoxus]KPV16274.1 multidrug ABC transporter ATP-binding protein [Variovorax paradoxus]KPV17804.1 multidrug ABC transporter ATP-binding protein [Variovorax paradoxus]